MIELVKENPCTECGIKGLYENCEDKCVQYRKWYQYQQGRADVLRDHREQCQGKCFKCEVSVPFVNSDGEEVILPYSYSYKTDCKDDRYINAKEVLSLIKQSRADAIDECIKVVKSVGADEYIYNELLYQMERLKEQKYE